MTKKLYFLILILFPWMAMSQSPLPSIEWFHGDFPPAFIVSGDQKGQGYCNKMEEDFAKALNTYKHGYTIANYKRIEESMKTMPNACCASIYKTKEREAFMTYSIPHFIGFSNGVVVLKKNLSRYKKYLGADNSIDLKKLLAENQKITVGIIKGRKYGAALDEIIHLYKETPKIIERGADDSIGTLNMLKEERMDMILALPLEFIFTMQKANLDKDVIRFITVKGADVYTESYVACSKSPAGEEIIKKINEVIIRKRGLFAKYYKTWLDKSNHQTYDQLVKKAFNF